MSRETYLDQVAELASEKSQGLTPRECAKAGMPLSPTELILLENALTIAEERIAELEAANQWITDDTLPPDNETVLVKDENGNYDVTDHNSDGWRRTRHVRNIVGWRKI